MAINLSKGGRVNLAKEAPGLAKVLIGLGWNVKVGDTGKDFDLDASVFACKDVNGQLKVLSDDYFIYYNHPTRISPDGAINHSGDNLTGAGDGDDEVVKIDLAKLDPTISEIVFVVTIHDAEARKQNFGQVNKSFIRICNDETGVEIARYALDDEYSNETALHFGSLVKSNGNWIFKAAGTGFNKGLQGFVDMYIG